MTSSTWLPSTSQQQQQYLTLKFSQFHFQYRQMPSAMKKVKRPMCRHTYMHTYTHTASKWWALCEHQRQEGLLKWQVKLKWYSFNNFMLLCSWTPWSNMRETIWTWEHSMLSVGNFCTVLADTKTNSALFCLLMLSVKSNNIKWKTIPMNVYNGISSLQLQYFVQKKK